MELIQKSIYITVRLDVEYDTKTVSTKEEEEAMIQEIVSEVDYSFNYNDSISEIINTEICGINE